jgi:phage/plasmid-associated DNA primase
VLEATAAYKQSQDVLEQFLRERTEAVEGAEIQAGVLHTNYLAWCDMNNERAWSQKAFAQRMAERPTNLPDWKRVAEAGTFYRRIRLRRTDDNGEKPKF